MAKYTPKRAAASAAKENVKAEKIQKVAKSPAEPKETAPKRRWQIICLVLLAAVVAYLVLCIQVDPERALMRSQVNGVDVAGMDRAEIIAATEAYCEQTYGERVIQVEAHGEQYPIHMGKALTMSGQSVADALLSRSNSHFLLRGGYLLWNAVAGDNVIILPAITNQAALEQEIVDCGLAAIDTTVQTTYEETEEALVFTMGKVGQSIDADGLHVALEAAVAADDYETTLACPMVDGTVEPVDVKALYKSIAKKTINATLDPENDYKIVASQEGVKFDVEQAQQLLTAGAEGSTVEVSLKRTEPEVTTKVLEERLFKDELGSCTTYVKGTTNRLKNVQRAAEKINGLILLPGDEFEYNATVGERTAANGFFTAGAYLNGETVQEYGGGICQVSSTAYIAVVRANLEITERHNHTYVSSYVEPGMDATVSWGGPDFHFKNDRLCPIKIVTYYSAGNQLTVKIMGTNLEETRAELTNEILSWKDFGTVYKDDASMYVGQKRKTVDGEPGAKVQTYRTVYKDGKKISKEKEAYSVYTLRDAVYYVGTKQKPKPKPKPKPTKPATDSSTETKPTDNTKPDTNANTDAAATQTAAQ